MRPSANWWTGAWTCTLVATKEGGRPIHAPYLSEEAARIDAALLRGQGYTAIVRPYDERDEPSYGEGG